ncbi:hypothetical protein GEMRC1_005367 [Eukaryota sp. GEM-RC1]
MSTPVETLCRGYPQEFATYLNYTRALRFDDKPDYAYLRKLFRDLFNREGFQYDYIYDWTQLSRDDVDKRSRSSPEEKVTPSPAIAEAAQTPAELRNPVVDYKQVEEQRQVESQRPGQRKPEEGGNTLDWYYMSNSKVNRRESSRRLDRDRRLSRILGNNQFPGRRSAM